jgi:hypothetical protein
MQSLIGTLATNIFINNTGTPSDNIYDPNTSGEITYPNDVFRGSPYAVLSKYQNNLSELYACFVLCYLDAVESNIGIWRSYAFSFINGTLPS